MAIFSANNKIIFVDSTRGGYMITGSSHTQLTSSFIDPAKIVGILEPSAGGELQYRIPSRSFGITEDITGLFITASNGVPKMGVGTSAPFGSFDVRSSNSSFPADITLRTNEDGIIEVGEETGRIRFLIESSSYNINNITTAISGASAEIFSRVKEVTDQGIKGSIVFALSRTTTSASIDAFEVGYEAGSSDLSTGDIHAVLSGSMEVNAEVPRLILRKSDNSSTPLVQLGSVDGGQPNHGSFILRDVADSDPNQYFVIRKDSPSYLLPGTDNFGINTSTPGEKLEVVGNISASGGSSVITATTGKFNNLHTEVEINKQPDSNTNGILRIAGSSLGYNSQIQFKQAATQQWSMGVATKATYNSDFVIQHGHNNAALSKTNNFIIQSSSGNVGIGYRAGNTIPEKLSVNGSVDVIGALTASGDISASNGVYADTYYMNNTASIQSNSGAIRFGYSPNWQTVTLGYQGKKLSLLTSVTASGDISASGNLFALTSDAGGASYNTLMVDTATGKFFHTGSYGGSGGGGTGTVTEVTTGNGLDVADGTSTPNITINAGEFTDLTAEVESNVDEFVLRHNGETGLSRKRSIEIDVNSFKMPGLVEEIPFRDSGGLTTDDKFKFTTGFTNYKTLVVGDNSSSTTRKIGFSWGNGNTQALKRGSIFYVGEGDFDFEAKIGAISYARFEKTRRNFSLFPAGSGNNIVSGLAKLHVSDNAGTTQGNVNPQQPVVKIINTNNKAFVGMLVQTATTSTTMTAGNYFKAIDIHSAATDSQVNGTAQGGIYWDPLNTFGFLNPPSSQLVFTGGVVQGSDRKLKKNITDTQKGINDILNLRVRDFNLKTDKEGTPKSVGLIAQEVQETFPELVGIDKTKDHLTVDYQALIPVLTKAIQDLQQQVDELKNQLNNK